MCVCVCPAGSIIRCMRRLEEVLRQMCSAAKAIGNTELENKFAEGENVYAPFTFEEGTNTCWGGGGGGSPPDVPRSTCRHLPVAWRSCGVCEVLAEPHTPLVFEKKSQIVRRGCIRRADTPELLKREREPEHGLTPHPPKVASPAP